MSYYDDNIRFYIVSTLDDIQYSEGITVTYNMQRCFSANKSTIILKISSISRRISLQRPLVLSAFSISLYV